MSYEGLSKSNCLYLSRLDQMNDKMEYEDYENGIRDRIYNYSMSFGYKENTVMWGLYCLPRKETIMLTFARKSINNFISQVSSNPICHQVIDHQVTNKVFNIESIDLVDVIYEEFDKESKYGYMNGKNPYENFTYSKFTYSDFITVKYNSKNYRVHINSPKYAGIIKSKPWSYENEVRIKLVIEKNSMKPEKIALTIIPELLENLRIIFGPWIDEKEFLELKNRVRELDQRYALPEKNYYVSDLQGTVIFKSVCDSCKYDYVPNVWKL